MTAPNLHLEILTLNCLNNHITIVLYYDTHINIDHQEMEIQKQDMENNAPSFRKDPRDNSTITSQDTRGEKEAMRSSIPRDLESMAVGVDKDFIKHRALSKRGNHDFVFPRTNDRTKQFFERGEYQVEGRRFELARNGCFSQENIRYICQGEQECFG